MGNLESSKERNAQGQDSGFKRYDPTSPIRDEAVLLFRDVLDVNNFPDINETELPTSPEEN